MSYRTKFFEIRELVDEATYKARADLAWDLLRPDALRTLDLLRVKFGPITVNDWHRGGQFHESGLRRIDTTTGAAWSMHRYGGAYDCKFRDTSPAEVSKYILLWPEEFPELTVLEDVAVTVTWLHFDVRNKRNQIVFVVKP